MCIRDSSYSTDPYKPDVRIREFKQMVQALHKAGIRVVLDVVCLLYTSTPENPNAELPAFMLSASNPEEYSWYDSKTIWRDLDIWVKKLNIQKQNMQQNYTREDATAPRQ